MVEINWVGEGGRTVAALYRVATMGWSVVLRSFSLRYSPKGVEGGFCELRRDGVLRSSLTSRAKAARLAYYYETRARTLAQPIAHQTMRGSHKRSCCSCRTRAAAPR